MLIKCGKMGNHLIKSRKQPGSDHGCYSFIVIWVELSWPFYMSIGKVFLFCFALQTYGGILPWNAHVLKIVTLVRNLILYQGFQWLSRYITGFSHLLFHEAIVRLLYLSSINRNAFRYFSFFIFYNLAISLDENILFGPINCQYFYYWKASNFKWSGFKVI